MSHLLSMLWLICVDLVSCGQTYTFIFFIPTPTQKESGLATQDYAIFVVDWFFLQRLKEEGQVVVYTTSFKAVRGRFELCKQVVQMLRYHRVKVDERDILVSPEYLAELKERLNDKISVPQVFINGQYIGVRILNYLLPNYNTVFVYKGYDELEELNETGKLKELLKHIPVRNSSNHL